MAIHINGTNTRRQFADIRSNISEFGAEFGYLEHG